jgi:hypothetical protein
MLDCIGYTGVLERGFAPSLGGSELKDVDIVSTGVVVAFMTVFVTKRDSAY